MTRLRKVVEEENDPDGIFNDLGMRRDDMLLTRGWGISNLVVLDGLKPMTFTRTADLLDYWCRWRYAHYERRWHASVDEILPREIEELEMKIRFVQMVKDDRLNVMKRRREEILVDMETHGFDPSLLSLSLGSFTEDHLRTLVEELDRKKAHLESVRQRTPDIIWIEELLEFKKEYRRHR